jgi:hypothetical protein
VLYPPLSNTKRQEAAVARPCRAAALSARRRSLRRPQHPVGEGRSLRMSKGLCVERKRDEHATSNTSIRTCRCLRPTPVDAAHMDPGAQHASTLLLLLNKVRIGFLFFGWWLARWFSSTWLILGLGRRRRLCGGGGLLSSGGFCTVQIEQTSGVSQVGQTLVAYGILLSITIARRYIVHPTQQGLYHYDVDSATQSARGPDINMILTTLQVRDHKFMLVIDETPLALAVQSHGLQSGHGLSPNRVRARIRGHGLLDEQRRPQRHPLWQRSLPYSQRQLLWNTRGVQGGRTVL